MVDAVFCPMIRFGTSPWPWHDQNHQDLARAYGSLVTNGSGNWDADWAVPLDGTVTFSKGSLYITGTGTSFQTDFCGGAGNTVPVGLYPAIVLSNGTRKYAAIVSGCEAQSRLRIVTGEDRYLPSLNDAVYSKTLNGAWWGEATNGSGGQNNANYYDNVLAQYALYYRSGLTRYLTYARTLADRWYDSPFFLRSGSPPRIWSLAGIMWRAWEGSKSAWWTDKTSPATRFDPFPNCRRHDRRRPGRRIQNRFRLHRGSADTGFEPLGCVCAGAERCRRKRLAGTARAGRQLPQQCELLCLMERLCGDGECHTRIENRHWRWNLLVRVMAMGGRQFASGWLTIPGTAIL
jgi:hypothetical protein